MQLPETEVLDETNYFRVSDTWKAEWNKPVQAPVNPEASLPKTNFCRVESTSPAKIKRIETLSSSTIRTRRNSRGVASDANEPVHHAGVAAPHAVKSRKYLCPEDDPNFDPNIHEPYATHHLQCATTLSTRDNYDYDELDDVWLKLTTEPSSRPNRVQFEQLIEYFEAQAEKRLQTFVEKLKNYNIE